MNISLLNLTYIVLCICFFTSTTAMAQSPQEIFESAFNKYGELKNLSLEMEAFSFEKEDSPKGVLVFQGTFKKKGDAFYSKAWEREMIVTDSRMLVVNHDDQKIVLGRSKGPTNEAMGFPSFAIDSLLAQGGSFEYLGMENGERHYQIKSPDAMIAITDVYINSDGMISRMVYHYQELSETQPAFAKMEIYYRNISFQTPLPIFFDESKFLLRSKAGTLVAAPRYKAYDVQEMNYDSFSASQF